ncbi:O-antigen ligase family protein [Georgenia sp. 10Sc9-8]|uniref:O-antigen ligase family protein n=1 Tax=Georgenia halotolerans TaxID=3028317 RepID=A0ABT5U071_9MICO|nr:O-antigen ligase family protein [Georgenia halotolerans]
MNGTRARTFIAAGLIWVAWSAVIIPRLVQTLTAPKYRTGITAEPIPYSALASFADRSFTLVLFGYLAAVFVYMALSRSIEPRMTIVVFLLPWATLVLRDLYIGDQPDIAAIVYPAIALAVWALSPRLAALRHLAYATGVTAAISLALGWAAPDKGLYRSVGGELIRPDKQIMPWGVLVGPVTSGNNLAQLLVLGLPAIALVQTWRLRALIFIPTSFAIVWTASRSSIVALGVFIVVVSAMAFFRGRGRLIVAAMAMAATAVVVVALPLLTENQQAFTNRGYIWAMSLEAWSDNPWSGLGSGWYDEIAAFQTALNGYAFHGHNQFIQTLVAGGFFLAAAVALHMIATGVAALRVGERQVLFAAPYLCVLAVSCYLEVSMGYVDRFAFVPVTTLPLAFILFRELERQPLDVRVSDDRARRPATSGAASRAGDAGVGEWCVDLRQGR